MTVITTVYDLERYVERCIRSVIEQTYPHWEQIIVDDGSSDRTQERIAQFHDPRIRYIRLPHRGILALAESYNAALAVAKGELVAVLEGDDFWPPEKLARQVPSFEDPEIQLTWGRAIVVDTTDRPLRNWPRPHLKTKEMGFDELFRRLTCADILTPTVTVMLRRSALDVVGGFQQPPGALFVDLPTWIKITARVGGKARNLDSLLGYYRVHKAQVSSQYAYESQTVQARVVDAMLQGVSPARLTELGWDERQKRRSRASAQIMAGIARLRSGQRIEARTMLTSAWVDSPSLRAFLRASLGILSTLIPYDFVAAADRLRLVFLSAAMKVPTTEPANRRFARGVTAHKNGPL